MYTTDPVVRSFNYGGRLQLNVNFSSQYYYARYITSLAWYHNGTRIFSGRKFTITDNDTLLSITDMEPSDAGEYTVRINSINVSDYLLWGHNDPQCDALVLPLLEFLAVHAPVTFAVQESCLQEYNLLSIATITQFFTESHALIELSVPSQYFLRYPMSWYRNGNSLSNDAIYNLTTSGQTSSLVINLNDTDVAAGSYVGISYLLVNDLYYGQFGSCSLYYYYLSSDLGLGVILSSISYWNVVFQSKTAVVAKST